MVITSISPGSTSSALGSSWESQSKIGGSASSEATTSSRNTPTGSSMPSNRQLSQTISSWRINRFAARLGFLASLAMVSLPGIVTGATPADKKGSSLASQYTFTRNGTAKPENQHSSLSSINEMPLKGLPVQELPTPVLLADFFLGTGTGNSDSEEVLQHGMNIAGQSSADTSKDTMKMPLYPDNLMQEYKSLMRDQRLGQLTVRNKKRLAEVRESIQKISRSDEKAQQAARDVRAVTLSLAELEKRVDARITKRKNEKQHQET